MHAASLEAYSVDSLAHSLPDTRDIARLARHPAEPLVWGHTYKIARAFDENFSYRAVLAVVVLIAPVLP